MREQTPITIDHESFAIEARPAYPPRSVGYAVHEPGKRPRYIAFGHPSGNNSTLAAAKKELKRLRGEGRPMLYHHADFDTDVEKTTFGLALPTDFHDTMIQGFLCDPYSRQLGLKPLAEKHLGVVHTERDELKDWILANVPEAKSAPKQWGAHISKAPGDLVGKYAVRDVTDTRGLHDLFYKKIGEQGMRGAYDRERQLLPILAESEELGVRVDLPQLRADCAAYDSMRAKCIGMLVRILGDINLDSPAQLANALEAKGKVDPGKWILTDKGNRSTTKEALDEMLTDRKLYALLVYHATLGTCLQTFMHPWLLTAEISGGLIYTNWKTTTQDGGGGARTGRLASSPNFQNMFSEDTLEKLDALFVGLYKSGFLPIPRVRRYIVSDGVGSVLLGRDYASQELRVLAHMEATTMLDAYLKDPALDLHAYAAEVIREKTGISLSRKQTKTIAFGLLYGMGLAKLAARLGVGRDDAKRAKDAYLNTFPGVKDLSEDLKERGKAGFPIRTWGGRVYYAEEPRIIKGKVQEFYYKLLNYLIQGSSADITKQAIINYHGLKREGRFLITAHDEILISCPKKAANFEMKLLKEAMESVPIDTPWRSDGETGLNWGNMKECA